MFDLLLHLIKTQISKEERNALKIEKKKPRVILGE